MSESRKFVIRQTALVLAGVMACVAVMLGVYALLGKPVLPAVLGGVLGGLLSTANFFFMAVSAELAADKAQAGDLKGGKALMQSSFLLRLAVLAALLFACGRSGRFSVPALVLPLAFVRPVLHILEFFRKAGETRP